MSYSIQFNDRQRLFAKVLCWYLVLCILFPPFYKNYPGGGSAGFGFGFVLSNPHDARIDTLQLLLQSLVGFFVAVIAIFLEGPVRTEKPSVELQFLKEIRMTLDDLAERIHKTSFDIETERLRINELDARVANTERAARLWQGLVSQNVGINPNQKGLL